MKKLTKMGYVPFRNSRRFGMLYGTYLTAQMLLAVPTAQWGIIGLGLIATLLRVLAALLLSLSGLCPWV